MAITASRPITSSDQRAGLTCSLKKSADATTINSGAADQMAVKLAKGMFFMQKKAQTVVKSPETARRS
jgi:hypothetical protein